MAVWGELWVKMAHMLLLQRGAAISTLQGAVFSSQILHFREKSFSGCSLYFHQHAKFSVEKIALSSAENSTCVLHLLEFFLVLLQPFLFQSTEFARRTLQRDASVLFHVKTFFPDHLVILSFVFRLRRLSLEGSCASALLDTDSISNESSLAAHSPWLSLVTRIESASTPSLLHRSEPSLESRGCSAQPANIAALDVTTALVEPFSGLPLLAELASQKLPQCAELEAVWCSFRSGAESDSLSLGSAASAPFSEDRLVLAPTELACCFMSLSCCFCLCTYFVSRVYLFHECVFHFVSYFLAAVSFLRVILCSLFLLDERPRF